MNDPVDQQQVSESHFGEQFVATSCNGDKIRRSPLSSRMNAVFAINSWFKTRLILAVLVCVAFGNSAYAQQSDPFAPAQPLADGWEQMDQRLIFLMVRLVDVEANLDAVDASIAKSGGRAASARSAAIQAERTNDRMDKRAGGPVRWDKFYGRTAEKFFYHPTENHTYHTQTILSQQSPSNDNQSGSGVPSRQGLPVHQRPPQFDYMYRANENAKERATAEVAKIGNKIDVLAARRQELELDQGKLWCEVAFRAVSRNDLDKKPLYRFMSAGSGQESLTAAASFVVVALSIVKSGESDQGSAFRQIKPLVSKARSDLGERWLQLGVKYQEQSSNEWKFATLARHLEDVSSNLSDSYAVSVDSAKNSDNDRRDMYRGLLQKSLVQYAEAVLALNEMASEMANANRFEPDLGRPVNEAKWSVAPVSSSSYPKPTASTNNDDAVVLFDGKSLDGLKGAPDGWQFFDIYGKSINQLQAFTVKGMNEVVLQNNADFCLTSKKPYSFSVLKLEYKLANVEQKGGGPLVSFASTLPNPQSPEWTQQIPRGIEIKLKAGIAGELCLPSVKFRAELPLGQLREERKVVSLRPVALNTQWNTLHVEVSQNKTISVKINNVVVNAIADAENITGYIVLWPIAGDMQIRNVFLTEEGIERPLSFDSILTTSTN